MPNFASDTEDALRFHINTLLQHAAEPFNPIKSVEPIEFYLTNSYDGEKRRSEIGNMAVNITQIACSNAHDNLRTEWALVFVGMEWNGL